MEAEKESCLHQVLERGYKICNVSVEPHTVPEDESHTRGWLYVAENTEEFEAAMCKLFDKPVGTPFKIFTPSNACISAASLVRLLQGGSAGAQTLQAINVVQGDQLFLSLAFQPDVVQVRDTDSEDDDDDSAESAEQRASNTGKGYTAILNECLSMFIPRGQDDTLLAKKDGRFKEEAGCIGSEFGPPCLLTYMSCWVVV